MSSRSQSTRIPWRTCSSPCIRRPRITRTRWPRNAWPKNSAPRSTSACTSRRPIRPPGRRTCCAERGRCVVTCRGCHPEHAEGPGRAWEDHREGRLSYAVCRLSTRAAPDPPADLPGARGHGVMRVCSKVMPQAASRTHHVSYLCIWTAGRVQDDHG